MPAATVSVSASRSVPTRAWRHFPAPSAILLERHRRNVLLDRSKEELFAVFMSQGPGQREYFRTLVRSLVYSALE